VDDKLLDAGISYLFDQSSILKEFVFAQNSFGGPKKNKKNIFSCDYVVAAISLDVHWVLSIVKLQKCAICSFSRAQGEKGSHDSMDGIPVNSTFILDSMKERRGWSQVREQAKQKLKALLPQLYTADDSDYQYAEGLPRQENYDDCGLYLLLYLEMFLRGPEGFMERLEKKEKQDFKLRKDVRSHFHEFLSAKILNIPNTEGLSFQEPAPGYFTDCISSCMQSMGVKVLDLAEEDRSRDIPKWAQYLAVNRYETESFILIVDVKNGNSKSLLVAKTESSSPTDVDIRSKIREIEGRLPWPSPRRSRAEAQIIRVNLSNYPQFASQVDLWVLCIYTILDQELPRSLNTALWSSVFRIWGGSDIHDTTLGLSVERITRMKSSGTNLEAEGPGENLLEIMGLLDMQLRFAKEVLDICNKIHALLNTPVLAAVSTIISDPTGALDSPFSPQQQVVQTIRKLRISLFELAQSTVGQRKDKLREELLMKTTAYQESVEKR
jgi:hypothetical protein